ncbi:glycosyltransferase family 4 protein [Frigoribacterium sp. MCBA15_019]|uniref:glycosyltransferase family 4 protein n=1 Tax=Frigoribacterium sp. MCBA15_019 TaxID=1898745 RepID=UPI000916810C|nr:glycosyltransferase family 4 protein [Frigoribacterium sp. MCBA15_019]OII27598.1 hypothetical protein BIV04_03460 [Frigoribacterium sp. MCBA15_019]
MSDDTGPAEEARVSVLVFAPRYPPAYRGGGPIRTLEALARTVPTRFSVKVITRDRDHGVDEPLPVEVEKWTMRDGVTVRYTHVERLRHHMSALKDAREVRPELLYVNSFFDFRLSIVPQILNALHWFGRPVLLVAPRGEFGAEAIGSKSTKKRSFIAAYRLLHLPARVTWHASSAFEEADIRRLWGAKARVVVRQNDTLLPEKSDQSGIPGKPVDGPLALVSVGRLVEHKGLHLAIAGLRSAPAPVTLDVYGPAEDAAYRDRCVALVDDLPEHVVVRFHESLPHDRVRATLKNYDAMVMPTAGENFGHVIAESLSVACAVICSDSTPWSSRLAAGGGVIVSERNAAEWGKAVRAYVELSPAARLKARHEAGRAYDEWQKEAAQPHVLDLALRSTTASPLRRVRT